MDSLKRWIKNCLLFLQQQTLQKILKSQDIWLILDRIKVPGFGTNLLRVYYPVSDVAKPLWGHGDKQHSAIKQLFESQQVKFDNLLKDCEAFYGDLKTWPEVEDRAEPQKPYFSSGFMNVADSLMLYSLLRHFKPQRFFEVGSGMSTKIANEARRAGKFSMEIVSIDPRPRQAIDNLCDRVVRKPFEETRAEDYQELSAGDVLYIDGSHYVFPGNDVVHLFFNVLEHIKPGVIIHIHDIFWPDDYSEEMMKHFWGEQYLLGAWLLGGSKGLELLFPVNYMFSASSSFKELIKDVAFHVQGANPARDSLFKSGSGFWLKKA
jgi:hypothetical protein